MNNEEVAKVLYNISVILEMSDDEPFKAVAYRRASRFIESMNEDINGVKDLEALPTIGGGIAEKITELLKNGKLEYYEKLKKKVPVNVEELVSIPGIGPKTIIKLYKSLKIKNKKELLKAAQEHLIKKIPGLGKIVEQNIIDNINFQKKSRNRKLLIEGIESANDLIKELQDSGVISKISVAGSVRRMKETIGDIDILCTTNNPSKVMAYFTESMEVKKVLAKGDTKSSVKLYNNLQADLRVVKPDEYGSALHHFTGSKDHNIALRKYALKKGIKINEYGLFKGDKRIAGDSEESVYETLGMQFIPPELRENKGEIELALENKIPKLVTQKDLLGEFHVHSNWSDGVNTINEIADYCKKVMGYKYVGIADHGGGLTIANSLQIKRIKQRSNQIKELNSTLSNFKVLNCIEANIKGDGSLDIPDDVLSRFDFVIGSVHYGFKMSKSEMTNRFLKALDNPYLSIIGHPTCINYLKRPSVEYDFNKVFTKAANKNVVLEIDGFPDRMDLNSDLVRLAKSCGAKFSIDTDAHMNEHLNYINIGVGIARRGMLTKKDVINTQKM